MRSSHERKAHAKYSRNKFPELHEMFKASDDANRIRSWLINLLDRPTVSTIPVGARLPLKDVRLQQLRDFGINTADFLSWHRGELIEHELEAFHAIHPRLSLRTFREENYGEPSPKLPFACDVTKLDFIRDFCRINNQDYHTLVNEALSLKDSICAVNLVLLDDNRYIASCIEGRTTPRDIDSPNAKLSVFMREFESTVPSWTPGFIPGMANRLRNLVPLIRPITVEISQYPYLVGKLQQPVVAWEWRDGTCHDLKRIEDYFMEQASSFELTVNIDAQPAALARCL